MDKKANLFVLEAMAAKEGSSRALWALKVDGSQEESQMVGPFDSLPKKSCYPELPSYVLPLRLCSAFAAGDSFLTGLPLRMQKMQTLSSLEAALLVWHWSVLLVCDACIFMARDTILTYIYSLKDLFKRSVEGVVGRGWRFKQNIRMDITSRPILQSRFVIDECVSGLSEG